MGYVSFARGYVPGEINKLGEVDSLDTSRDVPFP